MNENMLIKVTIGLLIVLALGIFINQKYQLIGNQPATYEYSNGQESFTVTRVKEGDYLGYQVTLFFGNNQQPYYISIRNDPKSLEKIPIQGQPREAISHAKNGFITLDPRENMTSKATIAALELDKVIDNKYFYNIPIHSSVTSEYEELPIITCQNATAETLVIWIRKGPETRVTEVNKCIIVQGKDESEIIKAADRLSLHLLGIMQ